MSGSIDDPRYKLWGSFLLFVQVFFPKVTGRPFLISQPTCRESHFITIAKELTLVARMQTPSLNINVSPGSAKSTLCAYWVAWTMSRYPNSQYIYVSYAKSLATKHTEMIKRIIENRYYQDIFDVHIRHDSRAKEFFTTTAGGAVKAFGSGGAITGQDAGLPNVPHFSGAVILDDLHKPDEAHSDTIRQSVIDNYKETILQRPRGPNVPIIHIGQRVHEEDIAAHFLSGNDEREWKHVILKSIDDAGNAMYPEVNPLEQLLEKKEKSPYVFSAQYQQEPVPAGGALFKRDMFAILDEEPQMLCTFITADTAETSKSYNDATAFAFWGIYKIKHLGHETGQIGLHCLDAWEIRVEPKDLEESFMSFYSDCMQHPVKPLVAAIEKKSTGVTLISVLGKLRGLEIREVKRTAASGSKAQRYLEMQPIIAAKFVSFTQDARHVEMCLKHMEKITANDSHAHDDLCFAAGTKIATLYGYKKIEDVLEGDLVLTPFGVRKVLNAGVTGFSSTISKFGLEATAGHKIFNGDCYERMDTVCDDVKLSKLSLSELLKWKYKRILCSMELHTDLWARSDIILVNQQQIVEEGMQKDCMLRFGNFITTKQYRKGLSFITKTAIALTMTLAIWNVFQLSNICSSMLDRIKLFVIQKRGTSISHELGSLHLSGTEATKEEHGILEMLKTIMKKYFTQGKEFALYAINPLKQGRTPKLAVIIATQQNIDAISVPLMQNALYAGWILQQKNNTPRVKTEKHALELAQEDRQPVYNLTIDKVNVYYANGILVSNCDNFYDGIKIALIDKTLYTESKSTQQAQSVMLNLGQSMRRQRYIRGNRNG